MANQRQYLLVSKAAYTTIPVTQEFIDCFGEAYEIQESENLEESVLMPLIDPTVKQYLTAINFPGGNIREIKAQEVDMVIIPIPWDKVKGDTALERYTKKVDAKKSIDLIFNAENTSWTERWLSESEARDFLEANKEVTIESELI